MTDVPMKLEEALALDGAFIRVVEKPAYDVVTSKGRISLPAVIQDELEYRYEDEPRPLNWALYIDKFPVFADGYRPWLIGRFLERFRTRRIAYATADEWMLAFRRWANLNMPKFNALYLSTSIELPLDDRSNTTEVTFTENSSEQSEDSSTSTSERSATGTGTQNGESRNVNSDFPQQQLSNVGDYASDAQDRVDEARSTDTSNEDSSASQEDAHSASSERTSHTLTENLGRGVSVMALVEEQRRLLLDIDMEVMESAEELFLALFDREEKEPWEYGGW